MKLSRPALFLGTIVFAALPVARAADCEALTKLVLPDTTITVAKSISSGTFRQPNGNAVNNLPAFCEVHGIVKPTGVSSIHFEVWMPITTWNGELETVGNGGLGGAISFGPMATALRTGYATASTDTGHAASDPRDWLENRELIIDYSYRGLHLTTVNTKSIVKAFYGRDANFAYFAGCSTGGKQALMEAQRFPEDYNGIVAGNAGNFWTHQMMSQVWIGLATGKPEATFTEENLELIQKTVLATCDAQDGATDGILSAPLKCRFDPKSLLCKKGGSNCLSQEQVSALEKIYGGPKNPRTGKQLYPGHLPGSEVGWGKASGTPLLNRTTSAGLSANDYLGYGLFNNPKWDFRTFDFDKDMQAVDEKLGPISDAVDPNLEPFRKLGHKMIQYHGASDPISPVKNAINYYESVVSAQKGLKETQEFYRAFLVPGMYHCGGGPGANAFGGNTPAPASQRDADHDMMSAISRWVEKGVAPEKIIATKYVDNDAAKGAIAMQRPICPYPQVPRYKGTGDLKDAASFACARP